MAQTHHMKLIREDIENVETLIENTSEGKNHYIEGIFMQMEVPNKNKRYYPRSVVEPELDRYITECVNNNRGWGELGHPAGPQINLHLVSHRIVELKQQGNDIYGKALITKGTPNGAIAIGLMEAGGQLGVSSRALGGMNPHKTLKGIQEVHMLRISTAADIVADPSAPNAFVQGIMEGADWVYDPISGNYTMEELVERQVQEFRTQKPSTITEEAKLLAFENFMSKLSQFPK